MPEDQKLKNIIEAALLAAGKPLSLDHMQELFLEEERPDKKAMREAIEQLQLDYEGRGIEIVEVGGGFRINVNQAYSPWVSRLWEERPAKYSRALLETLALIAYRQPITRGEIEDIRGVSVSTNIMKTLMEREWVRVVGQRDVPGRPSLYATTREFLNYFSLKSLDELPTLAEIRDLDSINRELELDDPDRVNMESSASKEEEVGENQDSAESASETQEETIAAGEEPRDQISIEDAEETPPELQNSAASSDEESDTEIEQNDSQPEDEAVRNDG